MKFQVVYIKRLKKRVDYKIGSVVENIGAAVANENEARLLSVKR
jgi:hypothetical protein